MRVFFATRKLCQRLRGEEEKELPLTNPKNSASEGDVVDLSECHFGVCWCWTTSFMISENCDLVSCSVKTGERYSPVVPHYVLWKLLCVYRSISHFMVVTESEFLLVDPDKSKIGWGKVHFISFLQVCGKPSPYGSAYIMGILVHCITHRMWMCQLTLPTAVLCSSLSTAIMGLASDQLCQRNSSLRITFDV